MIHLSMRLRSPDSRKYFLHVYMLMPTRKWEIMLLSIFLMWVRRVGMMYENKYVWRNVQRLSIINKYHPKMNFERQSYGVFRYDILEGKSLILCATKKKKLRNIENERKLKEFWECENLHSKRKPIVIEFHTFLVPKAMQDTESHSTRFVSKEPIYLCKNDDYLLFFNVFQRETTTRLYSVAFANSEQFYARRVCVCVCNVNVFENISNVKICSAKM